MLGEDDPTAPTPKLVPEPPAPEAPAPGTVHDAPAPGTVQHALEHCRTLRGNLNGILAALAGIREDIDRSLRDVPPVAVPSVESEHELIPKS